MIALTVVHGDIETAEEQESLNALGNALDGHWARIHGTNDTHTWFLTTNDIPDEAQAVLTAARANYSWWRVTIQRPWTRSN